MPLPLGHTAIGLATYETVQPSDRHYSRWGTFVFITILANLPDVDILAGLLFHGNGNFFHRGPTHSIMFAILAGYAASHLWRLWDRIPRLGFSLCFGSGLFPRAGRHAAHLITGFPIVANPALFFAGLQRVGERDAHRAVPEHSGRRHHRRLRPLYRPVAAAAGCFQGAAGAGAD